MLVFVGVRYVERPVTLWTIEPSKTFSHACECCGNASTTANGFVYREGVARAVFFVTWIPGKVHEHCASIDLIVGTWGNTACRDRHGVSLVYRGAPSHPGCMVVDASARLRSATNLVDTPMARTAVVGTPLAEEVFAIVDAIWLQDERVADLARG